MFIKIGVAGRSVYLTPPIQACEIVKCPKKIFPFAVFFKRRFSAPMAPKDFQNKELGRQSFRKSRCFVVPNLIFGIVNICE
jgi:hypothetical protein